MRREFLEKEFLVAYEAYADAIFRFCYLKTNDRELAEDLTQETFLKAWAYLEKGEKIQNARPFIYKLAGNLVIDWYRKKKNESLEKLMEDGFDPPDIKMNTAMEAELALAMNNLKKLEESDQDLIIWRYVEDLSPREIAEILKEEENTVSVRIHRALKRLKSLLQK